MFTVSSSSTERRSTDKDGMAAFVFSISSLVVMPLWLLMLVATRWRWTARIVGSPAIVAGAIALYAALVVPQLGRLFPSVARPLLPDLAALLGTCHKYT